MTPILVLLILGFAVTVIGCAAVALAMNGRKAPEVPAAPEWRSCGNCVFWDRDKSEFGKCRRYPRDAWPHTKEQDWCGEFAPLRTRVELEIYDADCTARL